MNRFLRKEKRISIDPVTLVQEATSEQLSQLLEILEGEEKTQEEKHDDSKRDSSEC